MGLIRRECLDHAVAFGEWELHWVMSTHESYDNDARAYLALGKDAAGSRPIEHRGSIVAEPMVGGTHNGFVRI